MSTDTATDRDTRRWRFRTYQGKDLLEESTCVGDDALNDAIDRAEANRTITRYAACPL